MVVPSDSSYATVTSDIAELQQPENRAALLDYVLNHFVLAGGLRWNQVLERSTLPTASGDTLAPFRAGVPVVTETPCDNALGRFHVSDRDVASIRQKLLKNAPFRGYAPRLSGAPLSQIP
jgi:hypothetical protein